MGELKKKTRQVKSEDLGVETGLQYFKNAEANVRTIPTCSQSGKPLTKTCELQEMKYHNS